MAEVVDNFVKTYFKENAGTPANRGNIKDTKQFARDFGRFLYQFHRLAIDGAATPSFENSFAGSNLQVFEAELSQLLDNFKAIVPLSFVKENFARVVKKPWKKAPVWLHGNLVPANIQVTAGKLSNISQLNKVVIGDPACDLISAWSLLDSKERKILFGVAEMDADTIARAQMWAILNALRTYNSDDIDLMIQARDSLTEVLKDMGYQGQDDLYDENVNDDEMEKFAQRLQEEDRQKGRLG